LLAELEEVLEGAAVEAGLVGFVAGEIGGEAGRVGHGIAHAGADAGGLGVVNPFLLAIGGDPAHGVFEDFGLHGPDAAHAPGGGDHLIDEVELGGVGGLKAVEVALAEIFEALAGLVLENHVDGGGETVLEGIHGGTFTALFGGRAMRFGAIGARRFTLLICH
jgi:hypothetical protein